MDKTKQSSTTIYLAISAVIILIIGGIGFFTSQKLSNRMENTSTDSTFSNISLSSMYQSHTQLQK